MAKPVIAIVGGESLVGRELSELLERRAAVRLIGADAETDTVTEADGEAVVLTAVDAEQLAGASIAILAGTPESSRKALELIRTLPEAPVLCDLTGALDEAPGTSLRAPQLETAPALSPIHIVAHPAALSLAIVLERLARQFTIERSVATVLEPASERGRAGAQELQSQATSLLSFQPLKQTVYDAQLAFNMLPRYGSEAPLRLEDVELRIDRHLAGLLNRLPGAPVPMPSLRLIQAPVFSGYAISLWVEFSTPPPGAATVAEAIAAANIEVRGPDTEPVTNTGVAGESALSVDRIEIDRNNSRAAWFWIVADNVRVAADTAAAVAGELLENG